MTVLNAFDGRFTITVAGAGTTAQLDFDASAAKVQAALVALPGIAAGDVVVTKAGGRWTITWAGALAGDDGWPFLVTAVTSVGAYPLSGDPSGPAVVTGFSAMTDGLIAYDGFEVFDLSLGAGDDVVTVDDTLTGSTTVNTGGGDDRVFLEAIGGPTAVNGQAGDDWLTVNAVPDAPGTNPMDGQRLTLDGGAGSDYDIVYLWGVGQSRIDVLDTGYDGGTNVLVVGGPATDDVFLLRKRLIALLSDRSATTGLYGASEKVTYTDGINGSVIINGNAGDDTFALDDTATIVTINGGSGNDRFRVGQLFTAYTADAEFGIPAAEFFTSTRGSLSNGVSFPATINGGTGDDVFEVFRNKASLTLNGDAGDDMFIIRTFVSESEVTAVNSGQGRDYIEYATNAPVAIDGGDGNDLVAVIGTEFGDTFVITATGIYGAGRYVSYVNIERLSLYGMEGDDRFFVVSTNAAVQTSIYGGLGSDRVEVGAQAPPVQSNDLLGHTGLVRHSVESTLSGSVWSGLPVDGIGAEILDDDEPALSVETVDGSLVVDERTPIVTRTLKIRTTFVPTTEVEVTIAAPAVDPTSTSRLRAIELSLDGITWQTSVTLVFGVGQTSALSLFVRAMFDHSSEGERDVPLQTMVTGRRSGTVASATAAGLTVAGTPFAGRHPRRPRGHHHEWRRGRPDATHHRQHGIRPDPRERLDGRPRRLEHLDDPRHRRVRPADGGQHRGPPARRRPHRRRRGPARRWGHGRGAGERWRDRWHERDVPGQAHPCAPRDRHGADLGWLAATPPARGVRRLRRRRRGPGPRLGPHPHLHDRRTGTPCAPSGCSPSATEPSRASTSR